MLVFLGVLALLGLLDEGLERHGGLAEGVRVEPLPGESVVLPLAAAYRNKVFL